MRDAGRGIRAVQGTIVAMVGLATLALGVASAESRVGSLDPAFGEGGRRATTFKPSDPVQIAAGPDGSMVLANGRLLTRMLPGGQTDASFGQGGHLMLEQIVDGLVFAPEAIAVDSKGRVLVFGTGADPDQRIGSPSAIVSVPAAWGVVLRLTPEGQPDYDFGAGRGFVRSDFGLRSMLDPDLTSVRIAGGQVDSQDRPVFIARAADLTGRCNRGHTAITWYPRAVVRLTTAGSVDPGFGDSGIAHIQGAEGLSRLAVDAADGVAVAVPTQNCSKGGHKMIRLDSSGSPLPGFGTAGVRYYPGLYFSAIERSGAMVFAKAGPSVVRTTPAGELDRRFGEGGTMPVKLPRGADRRLQWVGIDTRGRTLLVGSFNLPEPQRHAQGRRVDRHRAIADGYLGRKKIRSTRSFLAITRLMRSGKTDRSLGKRGWIVTRFVKPRYLSVNQAGLDARDRLAVGVGSTSARQLPGAQFVIARYLLGD